MAWRRASLREPGVLKPWSRGMRNTGKVQFQDKEGSTVSNTTDTPGKRRKEKINDQQVVTGDVGNSNFRNVVKRRLIT